MGATQDANLLDRLAGLSQVIPPQLMEQALLAWAWTILSNPEQPEVLAVMPGHDEQAATQCLECLTAAQT